MVCMGSKNRIAKYIVPILEAARRNNQMYYEPFVGGGNIINKMSGIRLGTDVNKYLIALYNGLKNGFIPKEHYTKEEYYQAKKESETRNGQMSMAEIGYIGFCCSYSGKFFAGYAGYIKGNKPGEVRRKQGEMRNNLLSTFDKKGYLYARFL